MSRDDEGVLPVEMGEPTCTWTGLVTIWLTSKYMTRVLEFGSPLSSMLNHVQKKARPASSNANHRFRGILSAKKP